MPSASTLTCQTSTTLAPDMILCSKALMILWCLLLLMFLECFTSCPPYDLCSPHNLFKDLFRALTAIAV